MKAVWIQQYGDPRDALRVGERPRPEVGVGEVLVRVKASGINPVDMKRLGGKHGDDDRLDAVPNDDGAGLIEDVGPGVDASRRGERVWLYDALVGRRDGTAAEYVVVDAERAVPMPDEMGFAEGAALGVPALTAHRALFGSGPITGKRVLVQGASGGVGQYAVQLASWAGAVVIGTAGSEADLEAVRSLGAHKALSYRDEDLAAKVRDAAGGLIDRVIEVEFATNLETDLKVLSAHGCIATFASDADDGTLSIPFVPLIFKNASLDFCNVFFMSDASKAAAVRDLQVMMSQRPVRHPVARTFPIDEAVAAHEAMLDKNTKGKVILEV